jgi:DNA-binding transcriptional MerR regulator
MMIEELARRSGVPSRLLRFYEEQGILSSSRDANGYRAYGESSVDRVLQIREFLENGMTTQIIRDMLPCLEGWPEPAKRDLTTVERRTETLARNRDVISSYLTTVETGRVRKKA